MGMEDTATHERLMRNVQQLKRDGLVSPEVAAAAQDAILDDAAGDSEPIPLSMITAEFVEPLD